MQEKEVFADRTIEILKEIEELKVEAIWIRNKIIEMEQMPYQVYNQS